MSDEINKLLEVSEHWQRAYSNFLGMLNNCSKSERTRHIKRTNGSSLTLYGKHQ